MINVNKLFPRLSIRVKLAIAFALVALGPLAGVSVIGTRETVAQIRARARNTLEYDLQMSELQTTQALASAQNHIDLLTREVLGPMLREARTSASERAQALRLIEALLATEPSLYQVKLVDADGGYRFFARAGGAVTLRPDGDGGEYYAVRAATLMPRSQALFAVEVAGPEVNGVAAPLPAVAILFPVHDSTGRLLGAVVGEAYASVLFSHLERTSPGFGGITGLVDADGHFLYHSVRKRDWSTLLAYRSQVTIREDFPAAIAKEIMSGRTGTTDAPGRQLVSFRPLSLGASLGTNLYLYRVAPLATMAAPIRSFLRSVLLAAALVTLLVIGLAMLAAGEFTKPIIRIRDATWRLARNEPIRPLDVTTNDELEDLARDFALVAEQVAAHRAQREAFIAERTRLLEQTHAELTDILEHSADGIIGVDPAGVVRIWNQGAERLLGHTTVQAVGEHIDDVLRPAGDRALRERDGLRRELDREGEVVNFRTEVLARDGTPIQITITETRITGSDGRPLGSSLIVRDNRMQSRLEDQMRRSERLAAISVMAAGLAHEINNPLAIIGNRIECMQRDVQHRNGDRSFATDLDVLQQHVVRLRELTSSLLRFARDDQSDLGEMNLGALAEGTVVLLRRMFAERRVELKLRIEDDVPPVVGYEKAIETVLVNLLLNAADATPPGGVVSVEIRRSRGGSAVAVEVCDTGAGIPVALRERVFEPFFTTKEAGHGTGLGLTVCRTIVDRHGGSIRIVERRSGGCCFVITLPLQPLSAEWKELAYS